MPPKNPYKRLCFLALLGFASVAIGAALLTRPGPQSGKVTFVPLFQTLGKAPQSIGRAVTKVLPIDSVDEGELGKTMRMYHRSVDTLSADERQVHHYLNTLLKDLEAFKHKPFAYQVDLLPSPHPNAMAFPGGVMVVTSGLLQVLQSESELVAVLAHEMGHIEMSHCFDAVKYEMLSKKILHNSLGAIADFAWNVLLRHAFSKTQEDEADTYAFQLLTHSVYDPSALARSFRRLHEASGHPYDGPANPLRDYFLSHPPLLQRMAKFTTEAQLWWHSHAGEQRYLGIANLQEKTPLAHNDLGERERIAQYTP